jgi:hypothetical protein
MTTDVQFVTPTRLQPQQARSISAPRTAWLLLLLCHACILLQLPSAPLQLFGGALVYVRDVLLLAACGVLWLFYGRSLSMRIGLLCVTTLGFALIVLPAVFGYSDTPLAAAIYIKWSLCWAVAYCVGYLAWAYSKPMALCSMALFLGYCVIDSAGGAYEYTAHSYLIDDRGGRNETTFGRQQFVTADLANRGAEATLRVRALQRSVFEYSNLIGTAFVLCVGLLLAFRMPLWHRGVLLAMAMLFAGSVVISGGRSSLIGMAYVTAFAVLVKLLPRHWEPRMIGPFIALTIAVNLLLTTCGISTVVSGLSDVLFPHSSIGSAASSADREELWHDLESQEQSLVHFSLGAPIASIFEPKDQAVAIADNQYLWCLFNLGILGSLVVLTPWILLSRSALHIARPPVRRMFLVCLIYVLGEGVARDSFFFFSMMAAAYALGIANCPPPTAPVPRS